MKFKERPTQKRLEKKGGSEPQERQPRAKTGNNFQGEGQCFLESFHHPICDGDFSVRFMEALSMSVFTIKHHFYCV